MANLLKFYRGAVAPSAQVGMIWFDVTNQVIKVCTAAPEGADATWEVYGTQPADLAALVARVETIETVTIPGLETSLKALITAEETRAKAEEARIEGLVTAETTRATGKEAELEAAITTEKGRAEGVEAGLETRLAAVEADYLKAADKKELSDAIAAEATTARAAEKANADAIAAEKARLDAFLENADVTEKAVDTLKEIQEYITTHGEAAATMIQNIADNKAAIEAEVLRATTAEGNLQTAITNEAAAREAGDEANAAAIEAEVTRATAAEEAIAADLATLDAEVQEHEVVVAAALNNLNDRMTTAEGEIDALQAAVDGLDLGVSSLTASTSSAHVTVSPVSAAKGEVTVTVDVTSVDAANGGAAGLATDAYVREQVAASALCWMEGSF